MTNISVCIATYNGAPFIKRQLMSILSQLGVHDEVVVSDDSSADNTLSIINAIADNRIRIFLNSANKGPVRNFENALKHARGNLIFLADQDDIWYPNKVVEMVTQLKDYILVVSDCVVVNEGLDVLIPSFFKYRNSHVGFLRNIYKNSYIGCCMAFQRQILDIALPFPDKLYMHDWWIGLLASLQGKVLFYPKPLMYYVRHGKNISPTGEYSYNWFVKFQNRVNLLYAIYQRIILQVYCL